MRIASFQVGFDDAESKEERVERVLGTVDGCRGADLVLLPELWPTGFFSFDRFAEEAEPVDGPIVQALADRARALRAYIHTGSFVERDEDGRLANTSVLLGPEGNTLGVYRKIHLFGYGSREKEVLTPGSEVVTADTAFGTVGMATCYDLRFPEQFRIMVDQGAEFFLICSAWPYPRLEHWLMLNRVRALENQVFLVSANCVGVDEGVRFCGHSMIVDPWGSILAGSGDEQMIIWSEIDPQKVREVRDVFPPLRDRVLGRRREE